MNKSGLAFHCHHDVLFEYVYDYDERVRFIKKNKPRDEEKLRLKLFKLIPDELMPGRDSPEYRAYDKARKAYNKARETLDKAGEAYDKAWKACDKAREAYGKAWKACDKAWKAYDKARKASGKAREAYDKARKASDKAREACDKAREAYYKKYRKELEELHTRLCPDCPWDGRAIFSKVKK